MPALSAHVPFAGWAAERLHADQLLLLQFHSRLQNVDNWGLENFGGRSRAPPSTSLHLQAPPSTSIHLPLCPGCRQEARYHPALGKAQRQLSVRHQEMHNLNPLSYSKVSKLLYSGRTGNVPAVSLDIMENLKDDFCTTERSAKDWCRATLLMEDNNWVLGSPPPPSPQFNYETQEMREALLPVLNLVFMCLFQPKALLALCSDSLSLTTRSSLCHFSDSCWPQLSETVNTNTTLSPFASRLDAGVHLSHHCWPGGQEKEETGETNPPHSFVTSTWPLLDLKTRISCASHQSRQVEQEAWWQNPQEGRAISLTFQQETPSALWLTALSLGPWSLFVLAET